MRALRIGLFSLCTLVIFFAATLVFADTQACTNQFCPLAPLDDSTKLGQLYATQGDLSTFVNSLFTFAITAGAILAVLRLAYAGYLYMGSDMWSSKSRAKEVIGDVTLGVLLLLAVWLILYQINPDILSLRALQQIQSHPVQNTNLPPGQPTNL